MTNEARTLFFGILTLVVFAASMLLTKGAVIFPFPLNEFVFFVIAARFFAYNWNGNKFAGFLAVSAGVCAVLSTQFFWSFFNDQAEMIELAEGLTLGYFLLAFYLLIFIGGVATMIKQRNGITLLLSGTFLWAFVLGVFLNEPLLLILAYASMVASTQVKKVFEPYHLLWILLFVLKLMEWLTFFLNN